MGSNSKFRKSGAFFASQKGTQFSKTARGLLILLIASTLSCSSSSKKLGEEIKPPANYNPESAELLFDSGENDGAVYSNDGQRILFRSAKRLTHNQWQAYEMDIRTKKISRLTFQDGDVLDVAYGTTAGKFLYTSTTDEIKEDPYFIRNSLAELREQKAPDKIVKDPYGDIYPAAEIYESTLDGRQIRRLTNLPGFDGLITVGTQPTDGVFVSTRSGTSQIYSINTSSENSMLIPLGTDEIGYPQLARHDRLMVWVKRTANQSEIWISSPKGAQAKKIFGDASLNLEPVLHPNGLDVIFTSNKSEDKNFEIYAVKLDGTCVRRLTYNSAVDRHPALSPDGTSILFSSQRSGDWQVYKMKYAPPACAENAQPTKS